MLVSRHPLLALDTLAPIRKRQEGATTRRPDSRRFWLRPRAHLSHKSSRRRRLVFHRLLTACRHHSRTCLQRRAVATGSPSVIWKMNYGSWLSVLSRICSGRRRQSRVDCNFVLKVLACYSEDDDDAIYFDTTLEMLASTNTMRAFPYPRNAAPPTRSRSSHHAPSSSIVTTMQGRDLQSQVLRAIFAWFPAHVRIVILR